MKMDEDKLPDWNRILKRKEKLEKTIIPISRMNEMLAFCIRRNFMFCY